MRPRIVLLSHLPNVNMADKKKGRKHTEDVMPVKAEENKPSKEEFKVAKWLRKNVPIKKTKFNHNHNVEYFTGKRAVDALLESNFAKGDKALFATREEVVAFLHVMLEHKFYHRARKIPVSDAELKAKKDRIKKKKDAGNLSQDEGKKRDKDKNTDAESSVVESSGKLEATEDKEKRKKKIRLDMHDNQQFADNLDAYVWIYDPVPFHYWIMGTLLVLGTIGMCLFPLWPSSVRTGVYYLSLSAIAFFVSIILCVIIRGIIFSLIWLCTWGKHHLWILPNLTEEVGFFESFWPLYQYEYRGADYVLKKKNKKKKDKDSDAEEEPEKKLEPEPKLEEPCKVQDGEKNGSESESESSQRSSTGKDFEMVDQDDVL